MGLCKQTFFIILSSHSKELSWEVPESLYLCLRCPNIPRLKANAFGQFDNFQISNNSFVKPTNVFFFIFEGHINIRKEVIRPQTINASFSIEYTFLTPNCFSKPDRYLPYLRCFKHMKIQHTCDSHLLHLATSHEIFNDKFMKSITICLWLYIYM